MLANFQVVNIVKDNTVDSVRRDYTSLATSETGSIQPECKSHTGSATEQLLHRVPNHPR